MRASKTIAAAIGAAACMAFAATAQAQCVNKAGEGTGGSKDSAMFQAWEIILQTSDIGGWMSWMATSQKVGVAPGFKVSNLKSSCKPGGMGQTCVVQARLCK